MRNLVFFVIFSIFSYCFGGTVTEIPSSDGSTNFATATDSSGNTLAVWLDSTSMSYFYATCPQTTSTFNNGTAISASGSITTNSINNDLITIAYDVTNNGFLILMQTAANTISYTYLSAAFTTPSFSSAESITLSTSMIYDILAKYSTASNSFLVMTNSNGDQSVHSGISPTNNALFWSTSTFGSALTTPSLLIGPAPTDLVFDFDSSGNALAVWLTGELGGTLGSPRLYSSFKPVGGSFGPVSLYTGSYTISGPGTSSPGSLLFNFLKYSKARFLKGSTPASGSHTSSSYDFQNLNVFATGSSNSNATWVIPSLSNSGSSIGGSIGGSIVVLLADNNGNIITRTPITLYTSNNISTLNELLSAKLAANQMILSWGYTSILNGNSQFYYTTYNINNLLSASPSSFFNPILIASPPAFNPSYPPTTGYNETTLSIFNNIAFLSYSYTGSNSDTFIGWGSVSNGGSFSGQSDFDISASVVPHTPAANTYTANPTSTSPVSSLFVFSDGVYLYYVQQP